MIMLSQVAATGGGGSNSLCPGTLAIYVSQNFFHWAKAKKNEKVKLQKSSLY